MVQFWKWPEPTIHKHFDMIRYPLSKLVYLANRNPSVPEIFYPIKTAVLKRFGQRHSTDLQIIPGVRCHTCENGVFRIYSDYPPYDVLRADRCYHCRGTGWYKPNKIIMLDVYQLGKYRLHLPISRTEVYREVKLPDRIVFGNVINGYVNKPILSVTEKYKSLFAEILLCAMFGSATKVEQYVTQINFTMYNKEHHAKQRLLYLYGVILCRIMKLYEVITTCGHSRMKDVKMW